MPLFGKGKKKPAAGTSGLCDGWGIRAPVEPTGVPLKGEINIKPFRKSTKSQRLQKDRSYFNVQLEKLKAGYVSLHTLNHFDKYRTIGTGSFGRVLMVKPKAEGQQANETDQTGTFMALKVIAKARVVKTRQVEHTFNEKNVLFCMDSNFIVKMFDYFQDKKSLYMLLEFINGGEMFTHIQKQRKRRFNATVTNFFAAQTVIAFEYMHNLDIIFRDLKPENVLIDYRGNIRITDFGFAKRVDDRTWTMCGTPEYLAPEIIMNKGYNHAADWWAVGVLIYEMRCGRSPFEHQSQMEMFKKISRRDFKYPRDFTKEEQELIGGLLQVDLTRRLGNMVGGTHDIKHMAYFSGTDWDAMYDQMVPSPYPITISGPDDTHNFDNYPEENVLWVEGEDAMGDIFKGF